MVYTRTCERCGTQFDTTNKNRRFCSVQCSNKRPKNTKKEKEHKEMPEVSLEKRCEIAKKHGMSYGQMDAYLRLNGKTWMDMGRRETVKEIPGKDKALDVIEAKINGINEKIRAYKETIDELAKERDELKAFVKAVRDGE